MLSAIAAVGYAVYLCKSFLCYTLSPAQAAINVSAAAKNRHVAYGSLYLIVPGVYATAPIVSAWMANNSEPYYRRATSIAFGFVATNAVGRQYGFAMHFNSLTLVFR
jgi:hypothetical protein